MNTTKAVTRQRLALSVALLAPLLALTACNGDSDVEAEVGIDATAVVSGSGGAFAQEYAKEPAAEEDAAATDDMPADDDAGWESVAVVPASSVGMETPLEAYEAFLVSIASWDNAAACSLITEEFVAEMSQETQREFVQMEGVEADPTMGCVGALDATLAWFDLDQVREPGTDYTVVSVSTDTQHALDTRGPQHNAIGISGSGARFANPADERIGKVVLDYTDGIGWQVSGLRL